MAFVRSRRLDAAGNRRFSGAPMVPGADVWRESETAEALILMGAWCGASLADTTRKKTGMRLRPQVGSGVCQRERNRKKWSKVAQGGVLPLDGSLLMGDFPIGGFSPPEGRLARGCKPPAFSRFLFQSAVKSAESF